MYIYFLVRLLTLLIWFCGSIEDMHIECIFIFFYFHVTHWVLDDSPFVERKILMKVWGILLDRSAT